MKTLAEIGGTHYEKKKWQPINLIVKLELNFIQGNIVKYVTRYKDKNGLEDLRKALHYSQLGGTLKPINNALEIPESIQQIHDYCLQNNLPRATPAIFIYTLHQNWPMVYNLIEELIHKEYE